MPDLCWTLSVFCGAFDIYTTFRELTLLLSLGDWLLLYLYDYYLLLLKIVAIF